MPLILGLATWGLLLSCAGFATGSAGAERAAEIVGVVALTLALLRGGVSTARYLEGAMWSRRLVQRARRLGLIGSAARADFAPPFRSVPGSDQG
jgi:hypothetical protein